MHTLFNLITLFDIPFRNKPHVPRGMPAWTKHDRVKAAPERDRCRCRRLCLCLSRASQAGAASPPSGEIRLPTRWHPCGPLAARRRPPRALPGCTPPEEITRRNYPDVTPIEKNMSSFACGKSETVGSYLRPSEQGRAVKTAAASDRLLLKKWRNITAFISRPLPNLPLLRLTTKACLLSESEHEIVILDIFPPLET